MVTKYSPDTVHSARKVAALMAGMGGEDLSPLSDDELVELMMRACSTLAEAAAKMGVSAKEAGESLTRASASFNARVSPSSSQV
jgi:hypothetical protein